MVRTTYTTRFEKEELLHSTIRSVDNCFRRIALDRNIFHVEQAFKDNIHRARTAHTTQMRLEFARLAMQTWTPTSHTSGVGNIVRRLVLEARVKVLEYILLNWEDDTRWTMQDGELLFYSVHSHIDRNPAAVPLGPTHSQLNHMLLQLKQLST